MNVVFVFLFRPQSDLLRDHKLLNMLRELLVIFRIWGLIRQSCLPAFCYTENNIDVIATLFRILTRLLQNPEPDDSLLGKTSFRLSFVLFFREEAVGEDLRKLFIRYRLDP